MGSGSVSARATLAVAVAVVSVLVTLGSGWPVSVRRATATAAQAAPALPRLGAVQTVDSNDVGDPYILRVPPGVAPPSGLPWAGPGPDGYQSAPWSAATAREAYAHGWYVLFGTTDWQANVPTAVSTDLVNWTQAPDALPVLPRWAQPSISMTWAPAALRTATGWVLYYSTEEASSKRECIGAAVATSPAGPYTDRSAAPLLCQRDLGGSIDPSVVAGPAGREYLLWKNDGNSSHHPDRLWSARLAPEGLGLAGPAHPLMGTDEPWDAGVVEAPAMIPATSGGYWLFYSAGRWDSQQYGTGLARCRTVTGPCVDTSDRPFLYTSGGMVSPGGLDTFTALDGRMWAAFTALVAVPSQWHPGRVYYNRVLDIAPVLSH
ncbi:MAG TPA: glycoside hydrolase family 43 protein [Acidimicrobiales bacterium]|nr:glycoside hydrolase family 43 protein [Acidimicrobiales bacterium]